MSASRRYSPWLDVGVLATGCLIAWFTYFQPIYLSGQDVPGDLGDARFNLYVLEHVYRWISGQEASLLSPSMFWPYPYALAFSDTHAGTTWVYSISRMIGLDSYDAFKVWLTLGYFATFFAAYHVTRKLALEPLLAGALSFAFAFSLPAVAQIGHAQLVWRVAVPYCFWFILRYAEKGAPTDLFRFLTAFAVQALISVYLGMFTLVLCGLLLVGNFVARDGLSVIGWRRRAVIMISAFSRMDLHAWRSLALAVVALAALASLLGFHAYVASLYEIERPWSEIASMLPRLQSYFMMHTLPYWAPWSHALPPVPATFEHQIFLGIPLTLLAIAALAYTLFTWRTETPRLRALAFCVLAALVIYTSFGGISLYWLLGHLPGFNSIRAVARVMLVLAFPVALLIGFFLQQIGVRRSARLVPPVAALIIVGFMILDLSTIQKPSFSSEAARLRISSLAARLPQGDGPVAFGSPWEGPWYLHLIDASLVAQSSNRPTINGYSGFAPPGSALSPTCTTSQVMLKRYDEWAKPRGYPSIADIGVTPATVDMGDCDLAPPTIASLRMTEGRSLPKDNAPLIHLDDLEVTGDRVRVASVRVTNGTQRTLHANARRPFLLSWRIGNDTDWTTRVPLGASIPPGQSRIVFWSVPEDTQREDLSVSFVIEGKYWGHDAGFVPLRGAMAP